jgi:hypothetical protein
MAHAMSKQHYLHSTNDETKHVTGGCEREMTTTRHPVNATVLTGYNVDRRVNSTFGRYAIVCEKTKQRNSQVDATVLTNFNVEESTAKAAYRLLHAKPSP